MRAGIWREPDEESIDLYPGLVVHDGRQSGSITVGRSRLPLWAFVGTGIIHGWQEAERGWSPSEYGWTAEKTADFVYHLLEQRGEFARLLCILADVERQDIEQTEQAMEGHGPVVKVWPPGPDTVPLPPSWWEDDDMKQPVINQLRRCLSSLTNESLNPPTIQRGEVDG